MGMALNEFSQLEQLGYIEAQDSKVITKEENEIIKELKEVSIEDLTPLEALNILNKIINKL